MKKTILKSGLLIVALAIFANFTSEEKRTSNYDFAEDEMLMGSVNVGDEAPDIVMENPDGETMKLSDLRGQVVLIDFWASWCGPCRRENPNIVDVHNRYKKAKFKKSKFKVEHRKPTGFTVFSVSLDSKKESWKAAIVKDNLQWGGHVSDLKKWGSAAAGAYGVSSIPSGFLIDANGIVIAKGRDLRGPGLEANLKTLVE